MPHFPKPWQRSGRGWYLTLAGVQIPLGHDKKAAFETYHRIMAEAGRSEPITIPTGADKISVGELFDAWGQYLAGPKKVRQGTLKNYKPYIDRFIEFVGGDKPAIQIIPFEITALLAKYPRWSGTQQYHQVSRIKQAYKWAHSQGLLSRNPIQFIELPERDTETRALTKDQQEQILDALTSKKDRHFRQLVITMLACGARPLEIRKIDVEHVQLEQRVWHWKKGEAPKGKKPRTVWLAGEALDITRERIETVKSGPLFRMKLDQPWTTLGLRLRFNRLGKKVGIAGLRATDLRHTFATNCLGANIPASHISVLMGHADLSMISNVYGHLGDRHETMIKSAGDAAYTLLQKPA